MGMLVEVPNIGTPTGGDAYYTVGSQDLCVWGGDLNNTLTGSAGNDALYGMGGNDTLTGDAGNDRLDGGTGADKMIGGAGDDLYIVDNAGDQIIESANASGGVDTVQSSISWTLGTGLENLTLTGSANLNGSGNGLNNLLIGNSGNNILNGGAGNDTLDGGAGRDTLTGGSGADTFVFHAQTAYGATDTITDFKASQGDKLDLSDMLSAYDPLTKALSDFVHVTVSGANAIVSVDADGRGGSFSFQAVAVLTGVHGLPDVDALVAHGNLVV